jgi:DNA-binding IclR family transcriptional regulator
VFYPAAGPYGKDRRLCIAVPIRNEAGGVIAALSFSGFIGELAVKEVEYYDAILKEAAREISQKFLNFWREIN